MKHGQHIASPSQNSITKMMRVHIVQAMVSLLWGPFTVQHLIIDALTRELKEKAWFGPGVPLGENGELGEAHFSNSLPPSCRLDRDGKMLITDDYHLTFASIFIKQGTFYIANSAPLFIISLCNIKRF